ncbi:TPA: hypothetical protein DDZ75_04065 [Patescibacteria group bacterium]|nr:hypothetical protein [Patescibacteria group bacterium]
MFMLLAYMVPASYDAPLQPVVVLATQRPPTTVSVAFGVEVPIPRFPPSIPILPFAKKSSEFVLKLRVSTPFS